MGGAADSLVVYGMYGMIATWAMLTSVAFVMNDAQADWAKLYSLL